MQTSQGCEALTELVQVLKDDSECARAALREEMAALANRQTPLRGNMTRLEHHCESLEAKVDAMQDVLSSNLSTLCNIAINRESKEGQEEDEEGSAAGRGEGGGDAANAGPRPEDLEAVEARLAGAIGEAVDDARERTREVREATEGAVAKAAGDAAASLERAAGLDRRADALEARCEATERLLAENAAAMDGAIRERMEEVKGELMATTAAQRAEIAADIEQAVAEREQLLESRVHEQIALSAKDLDRSLGQMMESGVAERLAAFRNELTRYAQQSAADVQSSVDDRIDLLTSKVDAHAEHVDARIEAVGSDVAARIAAASATPDQLASLARDTDAKLDGLAGKLKEVLKNSDSSYEWLQGEYSGLLGALETRLGEQIAALGEEVGACAQAARDAGGEVSREACDATLRAMNATVTEASDKLESIRATLDDKLERFQARAEAELAGAKSQFTAFEDKYAHNLETMEATFRTLSEHTDALRKRYDDAAGLEEAQFQQIHSTQRDLYCGLYCTSKALKEKIAQVEATVAGVRGVSPEQEDKMTSVEDKCNAVQIQLASVEGEVHGMRRRLETHAAAAAKHHDDALAQHREALAASVMAACQARLDAALQSHEDLRSAGSSAVDQLRRNFEKRLVDHRKVLEQKIKDAAALATQAMAAKASTKPRVAPHRSRPHSSNAKEHAQEHAHSHAGVAAGGVGVGVGAGGAGAHATNEAIARRLEALEAAMGVGPPAMGRGLALGLGEMGEMGGKGKALADRGAVRHLEHKLAILESSVHHVTQSLALAHAKLASRDSGSPTPHTRGAGIGGEGRREGRKGIASPKAKRTPKKEGVASVTISGYMRPTVAAVNSRRVGQRAKTPAAFY